MADSSLDRPFARAGFALMVLALLTGLAVPAFLNTRMALAAHITGILNGLLLVAIGASWSRLSLSRGQAALARAGAIGSAYTNWATACLAAPGTRHRPADALSRRKPAAQRDAVYVSIGAYPERI